MPHDTTMLELVSALSAHARSEDEVVGCVAALVNSGAVRLCGIFNGTRFEASIDEPSWQPVCASESGDSAAAGIVLRQFLDQLYQFVDRLDNRNRNPGEA